MQRVGLLHARAEYAQALRVAEEGLPQSSIESRPEMQVMWHFQHGIILAHLGQPSRAKAHFEAARQLYDSPEFGPSVLAYWGPLFGIMSRALAAVCLWWLGYPDQAWAALQGPIAEALASANTEAISYMLGNALVLSDSMGRDRGAIVGLTEPLLRVVTSRGYPRTVDPLALWLQGEPGGAEEARRRWCKYIDECKARGEWCGMTDSLHHLAATCDRLGHIEEGLAAVEEALELARSPGETCFESLNLWLKGKLLLQRGQAGDVEAAETSFRQAISVAREQETRSWELRAATSLARVLASQGKREEAQEILSAIYGWFTEGFDTADLVEARALLDELA
jgi:adenylate cyclase